ncbi:hypothetical protein HAX54_029671, partial [Datura stramonium]|nr:hypothetical protein [Datura stramonium]
LPYGMLITRLLEANHIFLDDHLFFTVRNATTQGLWLYGLHSFWRHLGKEGVPSIPIHVSPFTIKNSSPRASSSTTSGDFSSEVLAVVVAMFANLESMKDLMASTLCTMKKFHDSTKKRVMMLLVYGSSDQESH